jgi:hypothetical protein
VAEPGRAGDDGVEHRLHIARRTADYPQDLARGGLLIQRPREVAIARLQLLEQPDVLDRDDGLVGEGLQEGDLFVREASRFAPRDPDCAERQPVPHHGHPYPAPILPLADELADVVRNPFRGLDIRQDHGGAPTNRLARRREDGEGAREATPEGRVPGRGGREIGRQVELVAGDAVYGTAEAAEEAPGAAHDGFEHWLRIGGRASDYPQDFGGRRLLVERRRQLAVARLQLGEQPRVLDRNDGLVGEGLQQGDLVVGERPWLRPSHRDGSDRGAVPEHRHREDGS